MTNAIVVPVRNGIHFTREAIPDMLAQDIGNVDVWVIDNGSMDGTANYIVAEQAKGAAVYLTRPIRPMSVAESWNFAIRNLFSDPERGYVLVVNNDVRLRPDTYRELVAANLPFATAVGVETLEQMNEAFVRSDREHPDFSCFLIRRECWEKVGPFDERYKGGYAEDAAYHATAFRKGVPLTCIGIPFLHYGSGTIKSANPAEAQQIREQADRNRELFRSEFGCVPGTPEYERLFSESPEPISTLTVSAPPSTASSQG